MIDFNIDDGDIIVLQKQNYAENGDIVVAGEWIEVTIFYRRL